jgi:DNA invertase Pin-like site-specific DNA recombinase
MPCKVGYTLFCMSIGVYIRVSSPKGQKTDSQRAELEVWLKRQRYKTVRWFEDRESATTMQRDAFQKLQAAIFAGQITTVVIWKLDRLARSLKEGVNVLADWCQRGIRVIAITQQIDLSGPIGHMIVSLLFGIAEIELQHTRERQAAGIALAKKRGVYTGRRPGTTKAVPTRAKALRKQKLTVPEIAQALGVKERTVYNYLSNGR